VREVLIEVEGLIHRAITVIVDHVTLLHRARADHTAVLTAILRRLIHIKPAGLTALHSTAPLKAERGRVIERTDNTTAPAVLYITAQVKGLIERPITVIVELITGRLLKLI
jgi:hypothetical protein